MRRFLLIRHEDESGISGVGPIAEGVQFMNGQCVLNWITEHQSMGIYPNIREMMAIHGHGGKTIIHFYDKEFSKPEDVHLTTRDIQ